jgi:hypothetical protein
VRQAPQGDPQLDVSDLQDAVADLLLQDELRVLRHLGEHSSKLNLPPSALRMTPRARSRSMKFSNIVRSKNSGELKP